jgi:hypothetical protein
MTDKYVRLSKVLNRTRTSITQACKQLEIDPTLIDIMLLDVYACDNCSYWCKSALMDIDELGTMYCPACVFEEDYYAQQN